MKGIKRVGNWPPVCDWSDCDEPREVACFCARHWTVYTERQLRQAKASR